MLSIIEPHYKYVHTSQCPKIYVDIDDTISDFSRYFCHTLYKDMKAFNIKVDDISIYNYTKNIRTRKYINSRISVQKLDWWVKIPTIKSAMSIWHFIKSHEPFIFTGVLDECSEMEFGKIKWIKKKLKFRNRHIHRILINKNKASFAVSNKGVKNILIDDSIFACDAWEAAGGKAYLFVDHQFVAERIANEIELDLQRHISLDFLLEWNNRLQRYCW